MVTLRPMTEAEFVPHMEFLREDYAQERSKSGETPIEEERENSNKQIEGLIPQGLATPDHYFWTVTDEGGAGVGWLWVHVDPAKGRAFIYDIEFVPEQRGKGYGRQTLEVLESTLRPMGVRRIGLNVFGKNVVARHLYDTAGYYVVATAMQKDI